ncbi:hypothetical protein B9Z65_2569 [Elsinoe australis]|uniref:glutathione transferase n=1 Tax=Elsinoe australis TaxID=40998 RepID=A0A2P8A3Z7_9PEZI|nr:hypothetical protein B9Z65_2569 [Elsinoe australis]
MAPIKLYGMLQSTCTQRVILTCSELSIAYELIEVNMMKGEHQALSYTSAHHPFGRVPALEDDDVKLFESRAICAYLLAKSALSGGTAKVSDVNGKSPVALGKFQEAASVEYSYFDPAMKGLAFEKMFKGFMGKGEADQEVVETLTAQLKKTLDLYEQRLKGQDYLTGKDFTLIDLYHVPWVAFMPRIGLENEITSRPNFEAWWKRINERQSWKDLQVKMAH